MDIFKIQLKEEVNELEQNWPFSVFMLSSLTL